MKDELLNTLKDSDTNWELCENVENLPHGKSVIYSTIIKIEITDVRRYLPDKPLELIQSIFASNTYRGESAFGEKTELNEFQIPQVRKRRIKSFEQLFNDSEGYKKELLEAEFLKRISN